MIGEGRQALADPVSQREADVSDEIADYLELMAQQARASRHFRNPVAWLEHAAAQVREGEYSARGRMVMRARTAIRAGVAYFKRELELQAAAAGLSDPPESTPRQPARKAAKRKAVRSKG